MAAQSTSQLCCTNQVHCTITKPDITETAASRALFVAARKGLRKQIYSVFFVTGAIVNLRGLNICICNWKGRYICIEEHKIEIYE